MAQGIAIVGLNGSGKSTLNHLLAGKLDYYEMDVEDYYFPEQKAHRLWALMSPAPRSKAPACPQPYTAQRSQSDVEAALVQDMEAHPQFVLSCVRLNWSTELLEHIGMIFYVQAPLETRLARIRNREEKRFGDRALPGGDMYLRQEAFRELVSRREPASVEASLAALNCPVIHLDGTKPPDENLSVMLSRLI